MGFQYTSRLFIVNIILQSQVIFWPCVLSFVSCDGNCEVQVHAVYVISMSEPMTVNKDGIKIIPTFKHAVVLTCCGLYLSLSIVLVDPDLPMKHSPI